MKNILPLIILVSVISCKKDKEVIAENKSTGSAVVKVDSSQIPTMENPSVSGAFEIIPQDVSISKGKAVFTQNGKTLFYFEQNSNKGNIRIDGKDYPLNSYDFNENNYKLSGDEVKIEATDGDFKDQTGDCVNGNFPDVKVTLGDKTMHLSNVNVQDCPNY